MLIDVAERLWAERGFAAVSLREICVGAGLSNPASVQYHYGDRDGLIWAIFVDRLPALDGRRGELLRSCAAERDLVTLLDCLFRPLFEQRNAQGRRSYAAFLNRLLLDGSFMALRTRAMEFTPQTAALLSLIRGLMPAMPDQVAGSRITAINTLVLSAIGWIDRDDLPPAPAQAAYADALAMAAAALAAPVGAAR